MLVFSCTHSSHYRHREGVFLQGLPPPLPIHGQDDYIVAKSRASEEQA